MCKNILIVVAHADDETIGMGGTIKKHTLKGDNVFKGYWKLEEKTKESFSKDGYFITGDLATRDDDGYFTIVGRDKDMIITGGLNVYPKEIETILNDISQVNESAVFGINNKDFGEAVAAAVVFNDG